MCRCANEKMRFYDGLCGLAFYRAFGSKHFVATGFNPLLHEFNIKSAVGTIHFKH
jgi:hypothetical protein